MERCLNVGIDITHIPTTFVRIQRSPAYFLGTFTDPEIVYCENLSDTMRAESYAGILAAKEAVIKMLGGLGERRNFRDIFVLHDANPDRVGAPFIYLEGKAKAKAQYLGIDRISVSIAHTKDYAVAVCWPFSEERASVTTPLLLKDELERSMETH